MTFSFWSLNIMSILVLVIGATQIYENSGGIPPVNMDPLLYGIVAMGIGLIIVIWFMYEVRISMSPRLLS
jgi:hypothetical protein